MSDSTESKRIPEHKIAALRERLGVPAPPSAAPAPVSQDAEAPSVFNKNDPLVDVALEITSLVGNAAPKGQLGLIWPEVYRKVAAAVLAERRACIELADHWVGQGHPLIDAIRARSEVGRGE